MMMTTWRILWIPVAGAILIFTTVEEDPRLRMDAGRTARHRSVRPVVNLWFSENAPPARTREPDIVTQRRPSRRWSHTRSPRKAGSSCPVNVSTSPATANVAVLVSVRAGRTYSASTGLDRPRAVAYHSRLVLTEPAGKTKL